MNSQHSAQYKRKEDTSKFKTSLPILAFLCLTSTFVFSNVEISFVLGIVKDYAVYPEKYVIRFPLISSIFIFDFLFIFPALLLAVYLFCRWGEKDLKHGAVFIVSCFYTFFITLPLFIKQLHVFAITAFIFSFYVSYFSFRRFLEKNIFLWFVTSISLISAFYFFAQRGTLQRFITSYALLFLLITFIPKILLSKYKYIHALLLVLLLVFQWYIIFESMFLTSPNLTHPKSPYSLEPRAKKNLKNRKKTNIILIVMDTFRADHLDLSMNGSTPSMASFAKEGVVYKNCTSTSSWTLPSHASLFTGLYPTTHGAHRVKLKKIKNGKRQKHYYPLVPQNITMAEILKKNGFKNYGIVSNYVYMHHDTGIAQGFDVYDDRSKNVFFRNPLAEELYSFSATTDIAKALSKFSGFYEEIIQSKTKRYRLAENINKSVKRVMKSHLRESPSKPFFLFVNYVDTHSPYSPVKQYRDSTKLRDKWLVSPPGWVKSFVSKISKEEKDHVRRGYKGEVMYLDSYIGELLSYLKNMGIYDNSLVIITSDHGDFLGEHGIIGHRCGLYREVLDVPLIVKYPLSDKKTKKIIQTQVQLVDILPTVLNFLGIAIPKRIEGRLLGSSGEIVSEEYENTHLVELYGSRFRGNIKTLFENPYKYILNSVRGNELYNLLKDPKEERNIVEEKKEIAKEMKKNLLTWVKKRKRIVKKRKDMWFMSGEHSKLRSLGYL